MTLSSDVYFCEESVFVLTVIKLTMSTSPSAARRVTKYDYETASQKSMFPVCVSVDLDVVVEVAGCVPNDKASPRSPVDRHFVSGLSCALVGV